MCGICGIVYEEQQYMTSKHILFAMRDAMIHRGPDDAGYYIGPGIALGSRRLSILDLSERGRMPMCSEDGRYWIVYNGELYNFLNLRKKLEEKGYRFHSQTDTEVLLYLYIDEGKDMLTQCNGMFAFAIWDTKEKTLFAARDRMGIKPFYYTIHKGAFYFASEEKALFAAGVPAIFDVTTLEELIMFRYVSGERTPFKNVYRLLPGHYLLTKKNDLRTNCWWVLNEVTYEKNNDTVFKQNEAIRYFQELLDNSIALRRISDVPVGVLLSGGLDSSGIATTMASQAGKGVASFTVRFAETNYDEGPLAKQVAGQWALDYYELYVLPNEIPSLIEEATWFLDEPLVHANDLHLLAISRYAKPRVTVLLSGEGADEILGGYIRYLLFLHSWIFPILKLMPKNLIHYISNNRWHKIAQILSFSSNYYRILFSSAEVFPYELSLKRDYYNSISNYRSELVKKAMNIYHHPVRQVMHYEQSTYLQSILDRNDRMTMAASIECRVPYLDYRIIEWLAKLPTRAFFAKGQGKTLLRHALSDRLPSPILQHKKWGFAVPWDRYFREIPALRSWIQKLPQKEIIKYSSLEYMKIKNVTQKFLSGDNRFTALIRQLFFISLWYEICIKGKRQVLNI